MKSTRSLHRVSGRTDERSGACDQNEQCVASSAEQANERVMQANRRVIEQFALFSMRLFLVIVRWSKKLLDSAQLQWKLFLPHNKLLSYLFGSFSVLMVISSSIVYSFFSIYQLQNCLGRSVAEKESYSFTVECWMSSEIQSANPSLSHFHHEWHRFSFMASLL